MKTILGNMIPTVDIEFVVGVLCSCGTLQARSDSVVSQEHTTEMLMASFV